MDKGRTELKNLAIRIHSGRITNADREKAVEILLLLSSLDTSLVRQIRSFETANDSWWVGSIEADCKRYNKNLVCGANNSIQHCCLKEKKTVMAARKKFWKNLVGSYNAITEAQKIAAGR